MAGRHRGGVAGHLLEQVPRRAAGLSRQWMSAPRLLRPDVTPPSAPRQGTQAVVPVAATRAPFTAGDAAASAVAMATVPSSTPSTGMARLAVAAATTRR